jgi:flagellar biosynthetic protein FliR
MQDAVATLSQHLGPALLVLFRVSGLAIFAPVLSSPSVPRQVKVLLVSMVALSAYPTLAAGPLRGAEVPMTLGAIAPLAALELFIGAVIGFIALLPLVAMQMGGLVMGTQMGLGFARVYNPAMDEEGDVLEQLLFFLGLAAFLSVGGLEQMTMAILRSFDYVRVGGVGDVLAVGGYGIENGLLRLLTGIILAATELALRVSAPLVGLFFLETVALGFLSKSVPSLNLMTLGFPMRIILGLGILVIGMGAIGEALHHFLRDDAALLAQWFTIGRGAAGGLGG